MQLELKSVKKSYEQGETHIEVLKGASLSLEPGQTLAIVGQSGSGKSTLLSLLAGLDRPDEGGIFVGGKSLTDFDEKGLSSFRARKIGIVFQRFHLVSTLSALENIRLPLDLASDADAKGKSEEALAAVGLSHRANHFPSQLSGGECQRVAIARAMVMRPLLLLADEPSGNLDAETGNRIMDLLFNRVHETGMTLILVTHNDALASRCQRVLRLHDGILQ